HRLRRRSGELMRSGLIGLVSALVVASTMTTHGCSSSTGGGGAAGSAGSSGGGGAGGSCSNVTSCGGNLVGTWAVTSSCLKVTGSLDLSLVGAGCPSAPVT